MRAGFTRSHSDTAQPGLNSALAPLTKLKPMWTTQIPSIVDICVFRSRNHSWYSGFEGKFDVIHSTDERGSHHFYTFANTVNQILWKIPQTIWVIRLRIKHICLRESNTLCFAKMVTTVAQCAYFRQAAMNCTEVIVDTQRYCNLDVDCKTMEEDENVESSDRGQKSGIITS